MSARVRIAIVFRGDRGLEPEFISLFSLTKKLRSSFGAIEDWNDSGYIRLTTLILLRSSFGAIEDWNRVTGCVVVRMLNCDRLSGRSRIGTLSLYDKLCYPELRSSFGAIEDWN